LSPNRNTQILDPMSPSYLCFRLDAYDRNGTEKKNEHVDDTVRLFRQNRRHLRGDVSFKVRCTLFTVFPFFSLSPNDETGETNSASEKQQTDSASNLANISARDLDHRDDRVDGDVYQESEISHQEEIQWVRSFFLHFPSSLPDDRWRRLSFPRSFSLNYRALGDLLSFAFVDSPRLSARIINDRPLRAWSSACTVFTCICGARETILLRNGRAPRAQLPSNYRYLRCQTLSLSFEPAAFNFQSPSPSSQENI